MMLSLKINLIPNARAQFFFEQKRIMNTFAKLIVLFSIALAVRAQVGNEVVELIEGIAVGYDFLIYLHPIRRHFYSP